MSGQDEKYSNTTRRDAHVAFFFSRPGHSWHYSNAGFISQAFNEWHFNVAYDSAGYVKIQVMSSPL